MSRGRATTNQTFFVEIYLLFLRFKRFEFGYDTNRCGFIYILFFSKTEKKRRFENFPDKHVDEALE